MKIASRVPTGEDDAWRADRKILWKNTIMSHDSVLPKDLPVRTLCRDALLDRKSVHGTTIFMHTGRIKFAQLISLS